MTFTGRRIARVHDLSERRRLPRLGVIRLGYKVKRPEGKYDPKNCVDIDQKTKKCRGCMRCTYPKDAAHFVINQKDINQKSLYDKIVAIYGDKPNRLDIMFPLDDELVFFPQAFTFWGMSRGWKCRGDGNIFERVVAETGEIVEGECPTPENCDYHLTKQQKPQCSLTAQLQFLLPKVTTKGIFQISTGSYNSIVDINSGIDFVRAYTTGAGMGGRIAFLPLMLTREPRETFGGPGRVTKYTMNLYPGFELEDLMKGQYVLPKQREQYRIAAPAMVNPALNGADTVTDEESGKVINLPTIKQPKVQESAPSDSEPPWEEGDAPEEDKAAEKDDLYAWGDDDEEEVPEGFEGVEVKQPEEEEPAGEEPPLFDQLMIELDDIEDSTLTSEEVRQWWKNNGVRIGQIPERSKDNRDQNWLYNKFSMIVRQKKHQEESAK